MSTFNYVQFTLVDAKTKIPVNLEPAKNGPDYPPFVTPTFMMSDIFSKDFPVYFGIVPNDIGDFLEQFGVEVVEEDFFYESFKNEMLYRVSKLTTDDELSSEMLEMITKKIKDLIPDPELKNMFDVVTSINHFLEKTTS